MGGRRPALTATATALVSAPADPNLPAGLTNVVAIAVGGDSFSLALKADGTVVGWGYNSRAKHRFTLTSARPIAGLDQRGGDCGGR